MIELLFRLTWYNVVVVAAVIVGSRIEKRIWKIAQTFRWRTTIFWSAFAFYGIRNVTWVFDCIRIQQRVAYVPLTVQRRMPSKWWRITIRGCHRHMPESSTQPHHRAVTIVGCIPMFGFFSLFSCCRLVLSLFIVEWFCHNLKLWWRIVIRATYNNVMKNSVRLIDLLPIFFVEKYLLLTRQPASASIEQSSWQRLLVAFCFH